MFDAMLIPVPRGDEALPNFGMEVLIDGDWIPADPVTWRAWTGHRRLWGVEYHGPVTAVDAKPGAPPWTGPRTCRCATCQSQVPPALRGN